jgi:hypothetical protein
VAVAGVHATVAGTVVVPPVAVVVVVLAGA